MPLAEVNSADKTFAVKGIQVFAQYNLVGRGAALYGNVNRPAEENLINTADPLPVFVVRLAAVFHPVLIPEFNGLRIMDAHIFNAVNFKAASLYAF